MKLATLLQANRTLTADYHSAAIQKTNFSVNRRPVVAAVGRAGSRAVDAGRERDCSETERNRAGLIVELQLCIDKDTIIIAENNWFTSLVFFFHLHSWPISGR